MNVILTYRGRSVTDADVAFLRKLIAENPGMRRKALSREVCRVWDWRQHNGVLKDAVCRGLLLALHRGGHLELPPPRSRHVNRAEWRRRAADVPIDRVPVRASLRELKPLVFRQVRRTPEERLFNALLAQHHELGYVQPVGEQLKYFVYAGDRVVAAWRGHRRPMP